MSAGEARGLVAAKKAKERRRLEKKEREGEREREREREGRREGKREKEREREMTRKELRAARMTFGFYRFTPRKRREPLFVPPRFLPKFSSRLARVNNRDQNIVRSRIEVGKDDERDDGREQQ